MENNVLAKGKSKSNAAKGKKISKRLSKGKSTKKQTPKGKATKNSNMIVKKKIVKQKVVHSEESDCDDIALNSEEEISEFDRQGTNIESAKSDLQLKSMLTQSDVLNIAKLVTKDIKELFTSELGSEQMLEGDKSPNSPSNDIK